MKIMGKLAGLHQAFWSVDPWYRRAWYAGPQAVSLIALAVLLTGSEAPPPPAQWVKPLPPTPPPQSADHQLCLNPSADITQRGEACDRVIKLGQVTGLDLAAAYGTRGWARQRANQIDAAFDDYTESLKHNGGNFLVYVNRGVIYYVAKNDLEAALRDFDKSIELNRTSANTLAFANRAEVRRRQGKLPEAQADIAEALKLNDKLDFVQNVRRSIEADVKRLEDRSRQSADDQLCLNIMADVVQRGEACDRVIRTGRLTGPDLATAYLGRGWMRQRANQTDLAIEDYSDAIKNNPTSHVGYSSRGALYLAKNDLSAAAQDFDRSIGINRGLANAFAFVQRAETRRRQGWLTDAQSDINEALKLNNLSEQAQAVRRSIEADAKRSAERANPPIVSGPDPTAIRARAGADYQKKDYDAVIAAVTPLIQGGSTNAVDYQYRGGAYAAKRQYDQALADLTKAADLPGHSSYAHTRRASILAERGEFDRALVDLDAAIGEHKANDAAVFEQRGRVHLRKEDYDLALVDFDKVVELAPDQPYGYFDRGQAQVGKTRGLLDFCRKGQGNRSDRRNTFGGGPCTRPIDFDDALAEFRKALEKKPDFAEAHFEIGRIMNDSKHWDDAVRAYTDAIRLNPSFASAYNNRGTVYQQTRNRELAFADYSEAIRINPRYATAYANRAGLFADNGQRQQAIADYRKALDMDGNNAPALEGLRRLGIRP